VVRGGGSGSGSVSGSGIEWRVGVRSDGKPGVWILFFFVFFLAKADRGSKKFHQRLKSSVTARELEGLQNKCEGREKD